MTAAEDRAGEDLGRYYGFADWYATDVTRRVLSAALTDPGDPDWLARALHAASQEWVEVDGELARLDWTALFPSQQAHWRRAADELRSAILGAGEVDDEVVRAAEGSGTSVP